MPATSLFKHINTDKFNEATERQLRRRYVEMVARCGKMEFILYGEEGYGMVEGLETFKYLG